jgi:hypothetical protein
VTALLHLAKDTLALHFPFQHLESLVDIVVTDKNLHRWVLFSIRSTVRGRSAVTGTYRGFEHLVDEGKQTFLTIWMPRLNIKKSKLLDYPRLL